MTGRIRLFSIIVVMVAAFGTPALGTPVPARGVRSERNRITVPEPLSFAVLEQEIAATSQKITSALSACARTVVTVAKAVVRALQAVVLALVKVIVNLVVSLVLVVGRLLLSLLLV